MKPKNLALVTLATAIAATCFIPAGAALLEGVPVAECVEMDSAQEQACLWAPILCAGNKRIFEAASAGDCITGSG